MNIGIDIVLADDHTLFRNGIKALLQEEERYRIIGEASDGEEVLAIIAEKRPDVVLLDLSMPGKTGIEVLGEVSEKYPETKCIVLSMHEDTDYIVKSVKAGAKGYLLKSVEKEELVKTIDTVFEEGKYFSPKMTDVILNNLSTFSEKKFPKLTEREDEVLKLVAAGKSTKQIAEELFISTRTVESHRVNMMRKLKASNTADLIRIALSNDII